MRTTNQKGFTLIESLVVLTIWLMILSLSVPLINSLYHKKTEEFFFNTLQYDILYVQSQAIGSNDYVRIILEKQSYILVDSANQETIRKLPKGWSLDRRTLDTISFNSNGAIRKAGTIQIQTNRTKYKIVFPLGKGRGYIVKQ
ncbi:competence type IV pilus minor pilin ComGD [Ornithinibacillus xuwenensis]|uniref:Competence type IV pilus minor pilin ComGD n=1 Tax=Ornithinibacillus xuwenensis TaxID=3144668 RepID=A0ABU9XCL3_9BACI